MMSFWCLALAVIASALAAPATLPAREPKKIVPILKQINQLNDDGSYTFGYEGGDGSFRVETKDTTGFTKGRYGYIDLEGKSQVLEYVAGKEAGSSVGFVPSGALVPIPIVRSISTPEQKALDFQYSSVDDDEDGMPDKVQGQAVSILSPASVPVVIPQQQKIGQFFQQPTFIRTSPAVIVRQQQQPIRKQFTQQDLQFQSVDANEDGIPDQAFPSLSFPIFGGRII
ncbi:hypothetical protein DAPPUDRAFT_308109 [Daphnia pulex]|uniref:Cuticular protein n=1 Tax=Daphnia pulex TaxID=6669 RepID=E9H6G0_DAPPU|nr:hypothetical protein DAPPUDRAFT_308109 [Daphnia pulex]|eukprot:EFX72702.1 hypothetical protein DAPPUDRAFT_308109 [Daphnia pulex]